MDNKENLLKRLKGDWLTKAIGYFISFFENEAKEVPNQIFDRVEQYPDVIKDFEETYGSGEKIYGVEEIDWEAINKDQECTRLLRRSSEIRDELERILSQKDTTNQKMYNQLETIYNSIKKEWEDAWEEIQREKRGGEVKR